ncbi:hypothetical protein NVP1083O_55 [Vibrio phage 1.083.O._10N.286.52.B9]|nr:hypothetical protein NVP1083O_55 [Vibrio phage 1.083.O._10N.286.52.B9]
MIKLGQVLHTCDLRESHDKNGVYKPRLVRETWVVCKVGKTKSTITPVSISDGVCVRKIKFNTKPFFDLKPNEVVRNYYKSEIAAVRSLVEKKNLYDVEYDPIWAAEWDKDQAMLKRAIAKLKAGK